MTDIATMTAEELESAFIGRLGDAQDLYERIVQTRAWSELGWDTFAGWWDQRVKPTMRALSMRPTPELASAVVEQVRQEEAELPPAQRRTQHELAEMVGATRDEVRERAPRSAPRGIPHTTDLDPSKSPLVQAMTASVQEVAEEAGGGGTDAVAQPPEPAVDLRAYVDADPELQDVRYRQAFLDRLSKVGPVVELDAERLGRLLEPHEFELLQRYSASLGSFVEKAMRARRGLRLIQGEAR